MNFIIDTLSSKKISTATKKCKNTPKKSNYLFNFIDICISFNITKNIGKYGFGISNCSWETMRKLDLCNAF